MHRELLLGEVKCELAVELIVVRGPQRDELIEAQLREMGSRAAAAAADLRESMPADDSTAGP